MNKEFNTSKIIKGGLCCAFLPFENIKAASFNGAALFILHREHSAFNFLSDYIENKPTKGGSTKIKSMLNITFITHNNLNASNAYPATSDLNIMSNNQLKTKYRVGTVLIPVMGKEKQIVDQAI